MLQAVQKLGFRPLAADASLGSLEPAAPDTEDAAAKPARGDPAAVAAAAAVTAAAAAAARQDASPAAPPQWTPPVAGHPTPPVATGATPPVVDASPGSFWEVLNAEICSPELDAAAGTPAMPPGGAGMQQQQLAPPAAQQQGQAQPTVQGLPMPPGMQAQQAQQALGPPGLQHQISGPGSVVVHTARVIADQKVMGTAALVLGVGTVSGAGPAPSVGWLVNCGWSGRCAVGALRPRSAPATLRTTACKLSAEALHLLLLRAALFPSRCTLC